MWVLLISSSASCLVRENMIFSIYNEQTNRLVKGIFMGLPQKERRRVSAVISAVTDANLTTAVRPFSFGGKVVLFLLRTKEREEMGFEARWLL